MTDDTDYKQLYEDKIRQEEQNRKWQKEIDDEKRFNRWFYVIFFAWLAIGLYACDSENPYGEGCYDADPTQYVDVYCD